MGRVLVNKSPQLAAPENNGWKTFAFFAISWLLSRGQFRPEK
jgi:hypothetical protein